MHSSTPERSPAPRFHGRLPATGLLAALLLLVACSDRDVITGLELEEETATELLSETLRCEVQVSTARMECRSSREGAEEGPALSPGGDLIMGGQNQYVTLEATLTSFTEDYAGNEGVNHFHAMVIMTNLIPQPLGTTDGESAHEDGIRAFLHAGPTVTEGSGWVTPFFWDGQATFTAPEQYYLQYSGPLPHGETTTARGWRFLFEATVEAFVFEALVVSQVPFPEGWLEVSSSDLTIGAGGEEQIEITAYSAVGNPQPSASFAFASSDPDVASVDESGLVTATGDGYALVTASDGSRSAEVRVTAGSPSAPLINSISPATLAAGASGMIEGEGFNPAWEGGTVLLLGGAPATITSITENAIEFSVPASQCYPTAAIPVTIDVGAASTAADHPFDGGPAVNLAVGEQAIVTDPSALCLHFSGSEADEAYLIGVQRVSDTPFVLTPVQLTSVADPAGPVTSPFVAQLPEPAPAPVAQPVLTPEELEVLRDHQAFKARNHDLVHGFLDRTGPVRRTGAPGPLAAPAAVPSEGDILVEYSVRAGVDFCEHPAILDVEVRKVTPNAIFLEDLDNPERLDQEVIDEWMDLFEAHSHPTAAAYFGAPSDIDANGRVKILATKEMNGFGAIGYVTTADWAPRSECGASSEGEIFYAIAPDPDGLHGNARPLSSFRNTFNRILAHEYVHVIQFGRRIDADHPSMSNWEMEGQATFAEEVVGHSVTGNGPGLNLGYSVAIQTTYWYPTIFLDHRRYFGWEPGGNRFEGAPQECVWVAYASGPCTTRWLNYAIPALLFRWISDHFGETQIHHDMINSGLAGFANLEHITGESIETLLAQWGAMLYVDDRIPGAATRLTLPTWDLFDIFHTNFSEVERLQPGELTFSNLVETFQVHSASTAYFRVSGEGRPATALRLRDLTDAVLPPEMQAWIVRLH